MPTVDLPQRSRIPVGTWISAKCITRTERHRFRYTSLTDKVLFPAKIPKHLQTPLCRSTECPGGIAKQLPPAAPPKIASFVRESQCRWRTRTGRVEVWGCG